MKKALLVITIVLSIISILSFNTVNEAPYKVLCDKANTESKNIIVYFAGSDWCSNCSRFKSKVLETTAIKKSIKTDYVYHIADFPQRTKLAKELVALNEALAEKLNNQGVFPLLVITDKDLNIKKVMNSKTSVTKLLNVLNRNK